MSSTDQQQSKTDKNDWMSPPKVLDPIQEHDHIDVDPCAGPWAVIAEHNFRLEDGQDGLVLTWDVPTDHHERVGYMNPPFGNKKVWLRKAVAEWLAGNVDRVYMVTPDETNTITWWQKWVSPYANWSWFPSGRVNYINPETGKIEKGVAGGSAVSVLGNPPTALLREWQATGDLTYRPGVVL